MNPSLRFTLVLLAVSGCRAAAPPEVAASAKLVASPVVAAPAKKRLTLEQTAGKGERVDLAGTLPRYSWAPDGVHLVHTRKEGEKERTVWIDPETWSESEAPAKAEGDDEGDLAEILRALEAAGVAAEKAKDLESDSLERAGGGVLVPVGGERWWVQGDSARRLADDAAGEVELAELAPDGAQLAFVQANDLVLVATASGERRELTSDGSDDVLNGEVLNGKLDWVYQEEIYGRGDFKGFWWSPDSRRLAFLRLDEHAVHDFTLVDHVVDGHFRVEAEVTRYPKVGDPNPTVALGLADVGGDVRWVDLSRWAESEPLVVRVDWTPGGERLVVALQDRIQTWMELVAVDPASGEVRTLLREQREHGWVNRPESPRWLADGSFLWLSEHTGQRHVYRHAADGKLLAPLSAGEWSVRSVDAVDEARGLVWFTANRDGRLDPQHYRVPLAGGEPVRLTRAPGQHSLDWNGARTLFLDRHSSLAEPQRLVLCDGDGTLRRELGAAAPADLETYATGRWELARVRARDGFELDVAFLKPVPFDPSRSYPVWLPTYSGPDAPSVSNSWSSSSWNAFLAQNGVIVFQVNVRSAGNHGQAVTESVYRNLGAQELRDLADAVDWLCSHPWADARRVGITGGSYGGYMTAYALTHSDRFALGIAASGVYDWRMYDTIYTERYMSTPALNPEGYAASSVLAAAANLRGRLVITHGEMDDNVHLQNAIQLVYALQKAGKDFELVLYPQSRHGIGDRDLRWHDRRMTWREIQRHLLGVEPAASP